MPMPSRTAIGGAGSSPDAIARTNSSPLRPAACAAIAVGSSHSMVRERVGAVVTSAMAGPYVDAFFDATQYDGGVRRTSFEDVNCSIAQTLEVVGDWWTMLVIRDVFLGVTRF